MNRKILFIGPHRPNRSPSQRFRMEQFFPRLREAGFEFDYSWFIDEKDDRIFYSEGNWFGKLGLLMKAIRIRLGDVIRRNHYDVIFIQREAFMTGSVFFEKQFSRSRAQVVYDFDDAIWVEDTSAANRKLKWLKRSEKTADIIRLSDTVIAGNSFLADYARQYNTNVEIIPTVIDTAAYTPKEKKESTPVNIGWSGSLTTEKHFELIVPVLKQLKEKWGNRIHLIKIGGKYFHDDELKIENIAWNPHSEVEDLCKIDIGLMPLPDEIWSKGKCGFKALQYMALEAPPVVSPVGVNTEIVLHEVNGLLATTNEDWLQSISALIHSGELRMRMGKNGRQTVMERYSIDSQLARLISILRLPSK